MPELVPHLLLHPAGGEEEVELEDDPVLVGEVAVEPGAVVVPEDDAPPAEEAAEGGRRLGSAGD